MFDKNTLTKEEKSQIINLLIEIVILYEDRVVVVFKNGDNSGKPLKIEDIIDQISSKKGQFSPPSDNNPNTYVRVVLFLQKMQFLVQSLVVRLTLIVFLYHH